MNIAARVTLFLRPGLCGDFNDVEDDDFRTTSRLIEGTASIFASTWKLDSSCVDVTDIQDPCTMDINKSESRAQTLSITLLFPHVHSRGFLVCLFP